MAIVLFFDLVIVLIAIFVCTIAVIAQIKALDDSIIKLKWDIGSLESEIKHQIKKGLDDNPFTPPFNIE